MKLRFHVWRIRYGRGAALALHVDRLSSHVVSAIINIQQVGSLDAETRDTQIASTRSAVLNGGFASVKYAGEQFAEREEDNRVLTLFSEILL